MKSFLIFMFAFLLASLFFYFWVCFYFYSFDLITLLGTITRENRLYLFGGYFLFCNLFGIGAIGLYNENKKHD